jgi:hypothetical protein
MIEGLLMKLPCRRLSVDSLYDAVPHENTADVFALSHNEAVLDPGRPHLPRATACSDTPTNAVSKI